jgi:patatin-like phospholipase/acyl hydrolase
LVSDRTGQRLCDYFDYIAGTSTGAIIAATLASGMKVREIISFYESCGKQMFEPSSLVKRLKTFYTADPLKLQLQETFGRDTNLSSETLQCLLLIVTKNVTTDSPWPISSNPDARYNDPARKDCNLQIPLWQLVRASTVAPIYFPPEVLHWNLRRICVWW